MWKDEDELLPPVEEASLVAGFCGPRGSGKSVMAITFCVEGMKHDIKCFSNTPIKCEDIPTNDGGVRTVEARHVEYLDLISFSDDLRDSIVFLDELPALFDSGDYQRTGSKLFNNWLTMLRKVNCALYYTSQSFGWADNRIRWQTDVAINCSDMFHTPQGKAAKAYRGEVISYNAMDLSGLLTGRPYDSVRNPETYYGRFYARPMWGYYDTNKVISRLESEYKIQVKKKVIEYDPWHQDNDMPPQEQVDTSDESGFQMKEYASGKE